MTKTYMPTVARALRQAKPRRILDAPSGGGWLSTQIDWEAEIDGIDLYAAGSSGYRRLVAADLDEGIPESLGSYDAIASCEGIEHLGNPLLFLRSCRAHLADCGMLVVTTPNVWHPASRIKYLTRGFFPGFPSLAGKVEPGTHMHIMPWSFPWLWLYLKLAGFDDIRLLDVDEPKPKYAIERLFSLPQRIYCRRGLRKAATEEERAYWRQAGSDQSVYGRRLVVSALRGSTVGG